MIRLLEYVARDEAALGTIGGFAWKVWSMGYAGFALVQADFLRSARKLETDRDELQRVPALPGAASCAQSGE